MPEATAKPTFVTLGPLRIRRRHFIGFKEETGKINVLLGAEGYGIYNEYLKDPQNIDQFWSDYRDYQSQGLL